MNRLATRLGLAGFMVLTACSGGGGSSSDAGGSSGGNYATASGTYAVTNLTAMDDGCHLALDGSTGGYHLTTLAVTTDGHALALGDVNAKYNPPVYAQGQGTFSDSTHATTAMSSMFTSPDGTCAYALSVSSQETVIGNNAMTVQLTQSEANRTGGCIPAVGATCTSTWSFSVHM